MQNLRRSSFSLFAFILALAATPTLYAQPATNLNAYVFDFGADSAAVTLRTSELISVLASSTVSPEQASAPANLDDTRDWDVVVGDRTFSVNYEPRFAGLRVINNEVSDDYLNRQDIGLDAARVVFRATLEDLIQRGVVDASLNPDNAEVRNRIEGGGWVGEAPTERIKEYWFYVPLIVDGARVRKGSQDAGVRISINRDGRLAALRVTGPLSRTSAGAVVRQVSDDEIGAQVSTDFPDSTIRGLGLNYVLDDTAAGAPVAPRQAYYISRRFTVNGQTFNSRAQVVSYGLDDVNFAYHAWPAPNPNDSSSSPRRTP